MNFGIPKFTLPTSIGAEAPKRDDDQMSNAELQGHLDISSARNKQSWYLGLLSGIGIVLIAGAKLMK